MRWIGLCLALVLCASCDDSTGPGSGPPEWGEVDLPAEIGEGFVITLATGADRVVALARGAGGEWVLERRGGNWEVLLDGPLPVPIPPAVRMRAVPFPGDVQDVAVDETGVVYAVGSIPPGIPGDRIPTIWAETDTGWVLHQAPEPGGALVEVVARDHSGIQAVGPGAPMEFVSFEGVPGSDPRWETMALEDVDGIGVLLDAMAVHRGTVYAGGTVFQRAFELPPAGLFLVLGAAGPRPLEAPCGDCPGLQVHDIEPDGTGLYWAGTVVRYREPERPDYGAEGWLARFDPARSAWSEVDLPDDVRSILDVLVTSRGTLYLAAETDHQGVFRLDHGRLTEEIVPEGATILTLAEMSSPPLLGAGSFGGVESRAEPLVIERGR